MPKKIISFKPGKITLYDKNTDEQFGGTLVFKILRPAKLKYKKIVRETSKVKTYEPKPLFKETPMVSYQQITPPRPPINVEPKKNIIREYWNLIDFPGLFDFLYKVIGNFFKSAFQKIDGETKKLLNFIKPQEKAEQIEVVEKNKCKEDLANLFNWISSKTKNILGKSDSIPRPSYNFLAKSSLSISVISFLLLSLYFAGSHLNFSLSANLGSPNPFQNQPQASLKPKQFEPTPDPTPISREFQITIEKIGLFSEITPNVDLADEKVYRQKLTEDGVAHALSSYFPGQSGPVYLFAHSTDTLANIPLFNAKFFALKDLELGDIIEVSYHGKKYKYAISDKQIIKPDDLSIIQNTTAKLILQTCWPPGTDWQRLIIFANPA